MALFLAPAALGLGDLVVTLPVVQHLIEQGEPVYLVVRSQSHLPLTARIPGLAGTCLEWEVPDTLSAGDCFIDLRDHPLQRAHWWGSKPFLDAYPNWTINDILSIICSDKGLQPALNEPAPQLEFVRREELADCVLFVPGSAVAAKQWAVDNWIELSRSVKAMVIGQPDECAQVRALLSAGLAWYETATIADALDAVSSCRSVVSVDTGIMHLAVHQGAPTVAVFRACPVYVRKRSNFRAVEAARMCQQVCYEREISCAHNQKPAAGKDFRPADWSCLATCAQRCMDTITVAQVQAALNDLHDLRRPQTGTPPLPARN